MQTLWLFKSAAWDPQNLFLPQTTCIKGLGYYYGMTNGAYHLSYHLSSWNKPAGVNVSCK